MVHVAYIVGCSCRVIVKPLSPNACSLEALYCINNDLVGVPEKDYATHDDIGSIFQY